LTKNTHTLFTTVRPNRREYFHCCCLDCDAMRNTHNRCFCFSEILVSSYKFTQHHNWEEQHWIFIIVRISNLIGQNYVLMHDWPLAPHSSRLSVYCLITNVKTVNCTILRAQNVTYTVFIFVYSCVGCTYEFWFLRVD
jgi:hypothetical protein